MPERLKSDKQREAIREIKLSWIDNLSPQQINNYIDNNITNLNSAKNYLKKLSRLILFILKNLNL